MVAVTKEECVLSVEMTSGKPVSCKWAAMSVTVNREVPSAWMLAVVLDLLSGLVL